ncbi:hypothetical protein [Roseovarius sp. MMSF_3350]|uniref:hypothetical protein n=1 Tax=Roseovarius sp. MMSF_3350 TaxID=3046706 RepID=UPI00273E7ABB|nr:hypothetical protein [Roseovarius sp. MMSF_3350]
MGGVIGAVGSIAGGLIGSKSAKDAAKAQTAAANRQIDLEERIYGETVERFQPFLDGGYDAQSALMFEMGLGPRPTFGGTAPEIVEFQDPATGGGAGDYTRVAGSQGSVWTDGQGQPFYGNRPENGTGPGGAGATRFRVGDQVFNTRDAAQEYADANPIGGTEYGGFETTPFQDYVLDRTQQAVDSSAASRGNLFSGATIKAQQDNANALTGGFYQDYLNRLTGIADSGQAAAGNAANAGANYASGAGNALANIGNAQAAGAIGSANALSGGINNAIGVWNYQNALGGNSGSSIFGGSNSLFGNGSWV